MARKKRKNNHKILGGQCDLVDDIIAYEKFKEEVLPAIRRDVESGSMTTQELLEKYSTLVAAKQLTVALRDGDVATIRDILDRTQGRPIQKEELTHKYESLSDEELDALMHARLREQESRGTKFQLPEARESSKESK